MQTRRRFLLTGAAAAIAAFAITQRRARSLHRKKPLKSCTADDEWRRLFGPMRYDMLRKEDTERPYTGAKRRAPHRQIFLRGMQPCAVFIAHQVR